MSQYRDKQTGKWYAIFRYHTFEGKNKQVKKCGFATKKEAKEYEAEFIKKMNGSKDMTLQSLAELYLEDCKRRHKPTSYQTEKGCIKNCILPFLGRHSIKDITPVTIRTWQNEHLIPKYKKNSISFINRQLSGIFSFGIKYYNLPMNPVKIVGAIRYMDNEHASALRFWTQEQFEQFMGFIHDPMYHLIFDILFWMGLRVGELCGLQVRDIDLEKGILHIERNREHIYGVGDIVQTPKTATSRRIIGMTEKIKKEMREYLAGLYEPEPTDFLFHRSANAIRTHCLQLQRRYDVEPRIRLHDLRHSHASLLLNMGIPAKAIADRLGHANEIMLYRTYGHLYLEQREELVDKLNKL